MCIRDRYYANEQLAEAATEFKLAVKLDGRFADAWNNLGNLSLIHI